MFHGNPKKFKPTDLCHPFTNETAETLYKRTIKKEKTIKQMGYNLIVLWESDFDYNNF